MPKSAFDMGWVHIFDDKTQAYAGIYGEILGSACLVSSGTK